ncbi:transglycosylase SLT domain-containing protein [Rubrivivax gelatinosus]|uniref:Soluble lytic murein transglycosylase-like protein n=1 Tax=Rubrivivax gelatinosus TaxID=28068 RepID=A0A4R2MN36_RUBGE|nr:lytic transglycosylase domain-containing protein [Rubrivivax gelatinosus]MBK1686316.1 lytic transglycosylase [Rubrivivax gelatinosus]TCP04466.1 soluble lytic murein transglycosylase-like protein [Rubrivivax gelatinosus]
MKPRRHLPGARAARRGAAVLAASLVWLAAAHAQVVPDLSTLPRPETPPPERGPVVPAQVERWRAEAQAYEYGDGVPRDALQAAQLYCRAARYGDAESQFNLAWMLTNARGIERDEAQAAHLFAAAAEQGLPQAVNMAASLGTPLGPPPPCLRPPEQDPVTAAARPAPAPRARPGLRTPASAFAALPPPPNAPQPIVRFVDLVAPEYKLAPQLVLAVMATESGFDPGALSPKNAQGLMQLMPDTAARFKVRKLSDPVQNIRGGMAYLRWLLAYYQGDLLFALAAYNAGEGAVDRYRGVPPYAETRAYVRRILASLGGQRWHPYDAGVTAPSPMLATLSAAAASPSRVR